MSFERRGRRRRRGAAALWLLLLGACSQGPSGPDLAVEGAWTEPPGGVTSGEEAEIAVPIATVPGVAPPQFVPAPLTGLLVPRATLDGRGVLAVKIDAVEAARPQTGLNEADVVMEELVEGGLTRLLALYHSSDPATVGPVRSARGTDLSLLMPLVRPLFASSGAHESYRRALAVSGVVEVGPDARPDAYRRVEDRAGPHDLFATPSLLRDATPDVVLSPPSLFRWRAETDPIPGSPLAGIVIDWGATVVEFRWDASLAGWRRSQDGSDHVDDQGVLVAPANVVVQFVEYLDSGLRDGNGATVPVADMDGRSGLAWVLSGGSVVEGTWVKVNATQPARYRDAAGNEVGLTTGRTWVLLAPDGAASMTETP